MAALSHDGSTHGATSMDHAHALPARPEGRRHRVSVFSRPGSLADGQTGSAVRRSRTAHSPTEFDERMGIIASTALAIVSLVFVFAVAFGSTLASAAILHVISPGRRFDGFRALHEPLVVALLFGLGVLWVLPPHPWAVTPVGTEPRKRHLVRVQATA